MGGILSKPKRVDTSKQDAILAEQEAEEKAKLKKREAAALRKRKGRRSLLFDNESGVKRDTQLGGGS